MLCLRIISFETLVSFVAEAGLILTRAEALNDLFQRHKTLSKSPQRLDEVAAAI